MLSHLSALRQTIHTLRAPGGCPWDHKQTVATAAHHLNDESAELLEAALAGDLAHVREELGDLLFMVCFVTELLGESQDTDLDRIAALANAKLIRRHPHVFGDLAAARDAGESQVRWNEIKAQEKRDAGLEPHRESVLKDLPASTESLHQAYRYQKDAAEVGFDWPDTAGVWKKLAEELGELRDAAGAGDPAAVEHELGDILFAVVNLARKLDVRPDLALRKANQRFRSRFHVIEESYDHDREKLKAATLDELEAAWQEAKRRLA